MLGQERGRQLDEALLCTSTRRARRLHPARGVTSRGAGIAAKLRCSIAGLNISALSLPSFRQRKRNGLRRSHADPKQPFHSALAAAHIQARLVPAPRPQRATHANLRTPPPWRLAARNTYRLGDVGRRVGEDRLAAVVAVRALHHPCIHRRA
jgi:hypothetical protein